MTPTERQTLTATLARLCGDIAADLRSRILAGGVAGERARQLHRDERVGEDFAVWTDLLSRRAAVLWVLKSVYVRVLEDRGLLSPLRIADPESQDLFERLAPNLGETAYLRWVYRDLAEPDGGLPELFAPQPAEVLEPSDPLSRRLLDLWRDRDPDTGRLHWRFDDEHFDGQLMGDLYQDLDPVVKQRYALLQTPAFVRDFILDRTLNPAIAEWGADQVRVLDPACGSGHFLLEAFRRLVVEAGKQHPERPAIERVRDVLARVVGIDLNDYACALARARLVMTALELCGARDLAAAGRFHPQVFWADALEQVEREQPQQLGLEGFGALPEAAPRAIMRQPEVRVALKPILKAGFHVVVANPPYITEKDEAKREYHRERYVSASRQYSLASPFTERCFQVACDGGFVGLITSNNFMKREFGKALIEKVLVRKDLFEVVDTAGAFIPGHGTPTVILFARNRGPTTTTVRAVMGKRGEPSTPDDPAQGKVWSSIVEGDCQPRFENEFVSVSDLERGQLAEHPWSLGGGGAAELKARLEAGAWQTLDARVVSIGRVAHTGADEAFVTDERTIRRWGLSSEENAPFVEGEILRDWSMGPSSAVVFPYDSRLVVRTGDGSLGIRRQLWPLRAVLSARTEFGTPICDLGFMWYEFSRFMPDRFSGLGIAFAFVATHNHFVLDHGGKVFKQSAPVIKLPADSTEDDHIALLGLLNSSTACFWMKQVFHNKHGAGDGKGMAEPWMDRYEFDSTKMGQFPVPESDAQLPYARMLDSIASRRSGRPVSAVLAGTSWHDARALRNELQEWRSQDWKDFRQMVGLQEELDWLSYRIYGLVDEVEILDPADTPLIVPGQRSFEFPLAQADAERRSALLRGETPDEAPTAWFTLQGWTPFTEIPADLPLRYRKLVDTRLGIIATNRDIALIEQATYKRRWYRPDYDADEKAAMAEWLADRAEEAARTRGTPVTARQVAADCQADPRINAVAEVYSGQRAFDLEAIFSDVLGAESVPSHPYHLYSETGLAKRAAWEQTWEMQRREDACEPVTPPVPPSYTQADFRKGEHFRMRGKLDVPKERFIAFTEVPGREGRDALFGWAGWTAKERVRALLALDEQLEDDGVPREDRIGVLDSAWHLLPDVAREDAEAASRFRAELQALVGQYGPSPQQLAQWKERYAPGSTRGRKRKA